jgi:hypothetical protein
MTQQLSRSEADIQRAALTERESLHARAESPRGGGVVRDVWVARGFDQRVLRK